MEISISQLSKYLSGLDSGPSTEITWSEEEGGEIDQKLTWNGLSCLSVISYVLNFWSFSEDNEVLHTLKRLNDLATEVNKPTSTLQEWEKEEKEHEIAEIFVKILMPNVQTIFSPPEEIEHLADFIHFLLQIMNSELYHIEGVRSGLLKAGLRYRWSGLTFLLAVLGDTPFQYLERQEVQDLLADFKALAGEPGRFIYSFVFRTSPVDMIQLRAAGEPLKKQVDPLTNKIQEYCSRYSELPFLIPANSPKKSDTDALFTVDSLLEDLESHGVHQLGDDFRELTTSLLAELHYARSFLKVPRTTEKREPEWVMQISYAASEADYLINSFVVGDFPAWYLSIRIPTVIQRFQLIRERLISRMTDVSGRSNREEDHPALEVPSSQTAMTTIVDDSTLVGFEQELEDIQHALRGGPRNRRTISIYGMAGRGKTYFAKKLYDHCADSEYFDKCAWSVVSQAYSRRKLLIGIMINLNDMQDDREKIMKMDENELGENIHKTLFGRRYLLVMDDVWDSHVWHDVGRFLPDNGNGSRILITTRIQGLIPSDVVRELPLLTTAQCFLLLQKKVFPKKTLPAELLDYGWLIASRCQGLPLVVVVIAGILSSKPKMRSEWVDVEQSMSGYTVDCHKILELSYKHLPNHLRLCFLYMCVFPEDAEIPVCKLIWLWISEGFIGKGDPMGQEELAREYLQQLIGRSLVIVGKKRSSTRGVKSCRIHDLLRKMCLEIAEKENFIQIMKDDQASTHGRHHRLAVPFTAPAHFRPFSTHCRSLFGHLSDPSSCLPQMKRMRVMQLVPNEEVSTSYKLKSIDMLVHLRYLVVDRMPEEIVGNLVNLEVLVVNTVSNAVPVPSVILIMEKLKHLHVKRNAKFQDDCDTARPNNLQSLSFVSIDSPNDFRVLDSSPHLRKLKCLCSPNLPQYCFPEGLESLKIAESGNLRNIQFNFPSTIKKLSLTGTRLPWMKMDELAGLQRLESLKLFRRAFVGKKWETSYDYEGIFPELKFLKLEGLTLEVWITSEDNFPNLEHLVLHKCNQLKDIPSELGCVQTLNIIEVHECSSEARKSAARIEKEQREIGNDLKVIITKEKGPDQGTRQPLLLQKS